MQFKRLAEEMGGEARDSLGEYAITYLASGDGCHSMFTYIEQISYWGVAHGQSQMQRLWFLVGDGWW